MPKRACIVFMGADDRESLELGGRMFLGKIIQATLAEESWVLYQQR